MTLRKEKEQTPLWDTKRTTHQRNVTQLLVLKHPKKSHPKQGRPEPNQLTCR